MRKVLIGFIMLMQLMILSACGTTNVSLDTEIIGNWKTSSFELGNKEYGDEKGEAFLDGVMIAHMQMFFKEGEIVSFNNEGKASFHGLQLDYVIENNKTITFISKQFGDMQLTFDLKKEGDQFVFKNDLGTAILNPAN